MFQLCNPMRNRVKVLRIVGRLNVGGPSIHVINLTAGLDSSIYEQLLVIGTEKAQEGSMLDLAISRGVRPHVMSEIVTAFALTPNDVRALAKLCCMMRRERPHIVHTHTAKAGLLGRLAAHLARVPVIVHTYHGHVLHGYYGNAANWLLRSMEKLLAALTTRIVTVSEEIKKDIVRYRIAGPDKITVIPLGFQLEPFLDSHTRRGQFRRELQLSSEHKLVGIVGRLFPIKNHSLFLISAAQVVAKKSNVRFVIVGDGVLRTTLQQQAHDLGIADYVIFTGWRRDLPRIYADLNTLVISSNNEGTPVSAIEAMAAGCPIVATRVGGLPDLITDLETGILVAPRDPEALATAIVRVLNDPVAASYMSQNAQIMARSRFAVERLIGDVEYLYEELLQEKASCWRRNAVGGRAQ
jgi:glycosyltransferase involved in cell wall biosynthesis